MKISSTGQKNKRNTGKRFHLIQYFSVASLISIIIAAAILGQFYGKLATNDLIENEERNNAQLAQYFARNIWPEYSVFLASLSGKTGDEIRALPKTQHLLHQLGNQISNSSVVKIKIFDLKGLTLFSTDTKQIGADKSRHESYKLALSGKIISHLTFRDRFYAINEELQNLNLLSSYIPIYNDKAEIQGVFELYKDVTPLINKMEQTQARIVLGNIAIMALLYTVLYLLIRRANSIICLQAEIQKQHEEKIQYQAYHDALTGLPNRVYFIDLLKHLMHQAHRHDYLIALLFLDLDRFKAVNDTLGHDAGDLLLKEVAKRMVECCREGDIVARLSGDEFMIILDHVHKVEEVRRIAQRLNDKISAPLQLSMHEIRSSVSIGITIYPFDDTDPDGLIKNADTAMYLAKQKGRNSFQFFTQDMNIATQQRLELEHDLSAAIKNNEFHLYYQPRVNLAAREITGVEALIRWNHPQRGLIPPLEFIPISEETGQIIPIGEWVIQKACNDIAELRRNTGKPIAVSINISARQFEHENLLNSINGALEASGLDPQLLELELTETMLMRHIEDSIQTLNALKNLGVKVALDDFGTGYSSLSYLKRFPIDTVKIDRSFISDIHSNHDAAALTSAITSLSHELRLMVVAEGVETIDQLNAVRRCGSDEIQGFLVSRPIPFDEFTEFLNSNAARLEV